MVHLLHFQCTDWLVVVGNDSLEVGTLILLCWKCIGMVQVMLVLIACTVVVFFLGTVVQVGGSYILLYSYSYSAYSTVSEIHIR